jgi:hypothetical protein
MEYKKPEVQKVSLEAKGTEKEKSADVCNLHTNQHFFFAILSNGRV